MTAHRDAPATAGARSEQEHVARLLAVAFSDAPPSLTPEQLARDLALAFPGIDAEILPVDTPEFPGPKACFRKPVLMPDGCPVYLPARIKRNRPGYANRIHDGFVQWLYLRGWHVFRYAAGAIHLLVPTETLLAAAAAMRGSREDVRAWVDENLGTAATEQPRAGEAHGT